MEKKDYLSADLTEERLKEVRRQSMKKFWEMVDREQRGSLRKEDLWDEISNFGLDSVLDLNEVEQMFQDVEKDSQGYARVEDLVGLDSSGSHLSSSVAQSVDFVLGLGNFTTNAERIISALTSVKKKYLQNDSFLSDEIDFAIDSIRK